MSLIPPGGRSDRRNIVLRTLGFVAAYGVLAGLASLPGRLEEISNFHNDGFVPWQYLSAAFFRDINVNLIFYIAFWLVLWTVLRVHASFQRTASTRTLVALLVPFSLVFGLASFFASEFRVERGVYPSWFDVNNAQGGSGVGLMYARLAFGEHVLIGWAAIAIFGVALARWMKKHQLLLRHWAMLPVGIALMAGASDQSRNVWAFQSVTWKSLMNWRITESPFAAFIRKNTSRTANNGFYGVTSILESVRSDDSEKVREGLRLLGLDPESAEFLRRCDPDRHPLRQELAAPGAKEPVTRPRDPASPYGSFGRELEAALQELSAALFDGVDRRVRLQQVLVETFLSADFASLGSPLSREAIPHWNKLIEKSRLPGSTTVVAGNMRQAGVRTSQAISASFCGLGTLPYLLSMGRDLQEIPLRCMPEVLKDAGFVTEMHHGYRPEFDRRTQFFEAREMDFWHVRRIPGSEEGLTAFWDGDLGLSDRRLFDFSLKRYSALPTDRSSYIGILTLSSHRPFKVPSDFLADDSAAAEAIIRGLDPETARRSLTADRIRILRYVDQAFGHYLEEMRKLPQTRDTISIVVAYGDHSHSDADLFAHAQNRSTSQRLSILSRIPFFIHIFPESLQRHPHRARVIAAVARLNALLKAEPVSQNDIPRLILSLLSHSRELKALPASARWHTLGGQTLSPWAQPPARTPRGVVWGVDGRSDAFVIDSSGEQLILETQGALDSPDAARRPGVFRAVTFALSEMLKHRFEICGTNAPKSAGNPHSSKSVARAAN